MNGWAEHVVCKSNVSGTERTFYCPIFIADPESSPNWPYLSLLVLRLSIGCPFIHEYNTHSLFMCNKYNCLSSTAPVYLTEPLKVCEPTRQLRFSSDSFILCFPLCACTHSLSQSEIFFLRCTVCLEHKPRTKTEHLHRLQTEAKKGAPTQTTNRG